MLERLRRALHRPRGRSPPPVPPWAPASRVDEDRLKSDVDRLLAPMTMEANSFVDFQIALAKELGSRAKVTTPNLASLMFLAREGNQTILLTGDGHASDARKGLKERGLLDASGK